jgi:hypothetical protein
VQSANLQASSLRCKVAIYKPVPAGRSDERVETLVAHACMHRLTQSFSFRRHSDIINCRCAKTRLDPPPHISRDQLSIGSHFLLPDPSNHLWRIQRMCSTDMYRIGSSECVHIMVDRRSHVRETTAVSSNNPRACTKTDYTDNSGGGQRTLLHHATVSTLSALSYLMLLYLH